MDEPTNHLDMESKERLESGLESFSGTLLFVSHDRYFINRLANQIWEVNNGKITVFDGNYERYLEQKKERNDPEKNSTTADVSDYTLEVRKQRIEERQERRRREEANRLEEEIEKLEQEKIHLQEELCQPEIYSNPEESTLRQQRLKELEELLVQKTERWADIAE